MDWNLVITLFSLSALIISSIYKIYWSVEHQKNQDKIIESKDAVIKLLEVENSRLVNMLPNFMESQYSSLRTLYEITNEELIAGKEELASTQKENAILSTAVESLDKEVILLKSYIDSRSLSTAMPNIRTIATSASEISTELNRGTVDSINVAYNTIPIKPSAVYKILDNEVFPSFTVDFSHNDRFFPVDNSDFDSSANS